MELHCSERKTKSFPDGPNDSTQPSINEEAINRLPQVEINLSLADLPTLEETKKKVSVSSHQEKLQELTPYQLKPTRWEGLVWLRS